MAKPLFASMKNGYNRYQVDDYLSDLENQLAMLHRKVDMYRQRNDEVEKQLSEMKQKHQLVLDSLQAKENAADEMARLAMKEANMIVDTAYENADIIVKEALTTARSILFELGKLGIEATELKTIMYDQLKDLTHALDVFEVPALPDMDLLKK